jgi:hypothetical protein
LRQFEAREDLSTGAGRPIQTLGQRMPAGPGPGPPKADAYGRQTGDRQQPIGAEPHLRRKLPQQIEPGGDDCQHKKDHDRPADRRGAPDEHHPAAQSAKSSFERSAVHVLHLPGWKFA